MARVRVYLKPFDDAGQYTDWIEVTSDVPENGLGPIRQKLDVNEYDLGIYSNSAVSLTLRNDHGKYSDVGNIDSIFHYKRAESLVKITWDIANHDFVAGVSMAEELLSQEEVLFTGILNDESAAMGIQDQLLKFQVLGREAILERLLVPYADIANEDLASEIILACLSQAGVTSLLTVDAPNIDPGTDVEIDDVSVLQNLTVKEALNKLLLVTNSVLYVQGDAVYVTGRTPPADPGYYFYGQASESGRENIIDISNIKTGLNRMFNFVTWADTALSSENGSTLSKYGYRKKEVSFDGITNNTTKQAVLDAIRTEFGDLKQEFELKTPIGYDVLALPILDRVSIDYPQPAVSNDELPLYEVALYGEAIYPKTLSSFVILPSEHYKITGRAIDAVAGEVTFSMRRI